MGLKSSIKKIANKAGNAVGLSGHDIGAIALSPFTAGASLATTSAAKNMMQNPIGTINGAITGFGALGPIGALLGGISGGGGFGSTSTGYESSKAIAEQYQYNLALQQQAQNWQTQMSNTAHQREIADLKAAGLNPVLSAGGTGASTGTVGASSVGMPDKVAEKTAMMQNRIAELTLNNELATGQAQREYLGSQSALNQVQAYNTLAKTNPEIQKLIAERANLLNQAQNAKSQSELAEAEKGLAEWNSKHPIISSLLGGAPFAASHAGAALITSHALSAKSQSYKAGKIGFRTIQ